MYLVWNKRGRCDLSSVRPASRDRPPHTSLFRDRRGTGSDTRSARTGSTTLPSRAGWSKWREPVQLLPILPLLLWLVALLGVGIGIAVGAVLSAALDRPAPVVVVDTEELWKDLPHVQ